MACDNTSGSSERPHASPAEPQRSPSGQQPPETAPMVATLLYFDDCPNWRVTDIRLRDALRTTGQGNVPVIHRQVLTQTEAEELQFTGSPTVLLNGHDPFREPDSPYALTCRMYLTDQGLTGAPTVDQLVTALRRTGAGCTDEATEH